MNEELNEMILNQANIKITDETRKKLQMLSKNVIETITRECMNVPFNNLSTVVDQAMKNMNFQFGNIGKQFENIKIWQPENQEIIQKHLNRLIKDLDLRREDVRNSISAKTQICDNFEFNVLLKKATNPNVNNWLKELQILNNKLHNKKTIKYTDNVEMALEFASHLNETFIYFNNLLLKLITDLDIPYDIYGKSTELSEDSNNVQIMLKKLINETESEIIKEKLKEIKRYFSLLEVMIRNFYSHGWLDIFPLICLENANLWQNFSLRYKLSGKQNESVNMSLKFFNIEKFEKELDDIFTKHVKPDELEQEMEKFLENYRINDFEIDRVNMMRSFLRKISLSAEVKNYKYIGFPKEIHIYNVETSVPLILSEEKAFEQINNFIDVIDEIINERDKNLLTKKNS